jgi:hypothetical protein
MAESGIPQRLVTTAGTVVFNVFNGDPMALGLPDGNGFLVQEVSGLDQATLRTPTHDLPNKSGTYIRPFWKEAKIFTVQALVLWSDPVSRTILTDHLLGVTDACLDADGYYYWTPAGQGERYHVVQLYEAAEILGSGGDAAGAAGPKIATLQFVAGDPDPVVV